MKIKYGEDNAEYWKVSWYLVNGVHEESLNIGKAWRKSLKRAKRASLTRLLARTWIRKKTVLQSILDLLQVDLLASGASLVWPRSGRPRATKSREVVPPYEIRRRTFLKVYSLFQKSLSFAYSISAYSRRQKWALARTSATATKT